MGLDVEPVATPGTADRPTPVGARERGGARSGTVAIGLLVGAVAALVAARPLRDNSFLTHLATGRLLLDEGLPASNPFLYTGTGFPVPSWWWSLALAGAERLGGATAIRLLCATLAAVLGGLLVALAVAGTRPERRRLVAVAVPPALALVAVTPYLSPRPHLAGFVLLATSLLLVATRRSPWWQLPVFAAWVNLHGTWTYGLVVLALVLVAAAIDQRRLRLRTWLGLLAAVVGTLLGGALYPRPWAMLALPARQFGDPVERAALASYREWGAPPLDEPMLWGLVGLVLIGAWGAWRGRRWGSLGLALVLGALGSTGARMVPVAAIAAVPLCARALEGVGSLPVPSARAARQVGVAAAAMLAAAAVVAGSTPGYALSPYPVEAVEWLDERGLLGSVHVLSHDYVGNYLAWRDGPRANAYVDDRPDAATMVDYVAVLELEPGWREAFGRADAEVVLWERDRPLVDVLDADPEWVEAATFGRHVVFCRVTVASRCT
jgi:hypothetical protein